MSDAELVDAAADAVLTEPEHIAGGFFGFDRFTVKLHGASFRRELLRVGRVVVMLPVDMARDEVVLIRQFRLGGHLVLGRGDMIEVPAGRVERGEAVLHAAHRECHEEIGVEPQALVPMFELMPSPGATDEHMFFFLALVDASKVPERAGLDDEHENIRPLRVPIDRALDALKAGAIHYGAAVFALQWLALNRPRLREYAGSRLSPGGARW